MFFLPTLGEKCFPPGRPVIYLPERHLTAKCSSGAARKSEIEDSVCAEQLPAVNVSTYINVKKAADKESTDAWQIIPSLVKDGKRQFVRLWHAVHFILNRI